MKSTKNPISVKLDLFLGKTDNQEVTKQPLPDKLLVAKVISITKVCEKDLEEIYTRILNRTMS